MPLFSTNFCITVKKLLCQSVYLGQEIIIEKLNTNMVIERRKRIGWTAFEKHSEY